MSYLSWLIAGLLMLGGCSRDPNSYDDCVLESMKGVSSDVAAAAIRKACRAKFPAVTQESVELPAEARKKIHGQAGMLPNDTFGGTIYNGTQTGRLRKSLFV